MLTQEEKTALRHVDATALNTWGIGGEDVMLVFKWHKELEVKFSMRMLNESDTVYVDLSIQNAIEFRDALDAAIRDAQRIDREYSESQE